MTKKMLIDATHAEETRVVVVDGTKVEEFDFETVNKRQLAGNIYLAKVTRVEPSLQAAFVDYGGNRHGFLAFSEIHPDYYQIPVADRQALLAEERAFAREQDDDEGRERTRRPQQRARSPSRAQTAATGDAVQKATISNMDVVDLGDEAGADALYSAGAAADGAEPAQIDAAVDAVAPDHGSDDHSGPGHDHDHGGQDHDHDHSGQESAEEAEPGEALAEPNGGRDGEERKERAYRAVDHASDVDDDIESIAEEDVAEEISQQRRPRARRYKIQEVVKVRQIMLVQVVKEERGNKGAALTTYLSLAGRYCVLMPNTARGGGISRKITNAADRKKLKEIAGEIEVPEGAGLIIRTAGSQRTKTEIKRDYEYLQRLWEQVRDLTLKSIAPAPIYEEGTLIKRVIRDLYNRDIEEVLVEGVEGYRVARDFMRMIMPSHASAVQQYAEAMPLFARFGVESYLASMFNPTVQLKSGGYIVIGITEALVAIDVNSGRATKEGSIEETALKTNLEAAEEVARQLRLRDLAGLIVIDFIDMEERKNNASVEKRLKDKLKTDRARIQVGRISGFGLMEMSRQRLRPGMLEASTAPCNHCHGTGLIRSDDSLALSILRQLEEEGTRKRSKEVLLKAPVSIINFLMNQKREHIAGIEARYGMAVRIEADPALISPDFAIDKFKTATRVVSEAHAQVVSVDTSVMPEMEIDDEEIEDEVDEAEEGGTERDAGTEPAGERSDGGNGKKKRRRRRRRKGGSGPGGDGASSDDLTSDGDDVDGEAAAEGAEAAPAEDLADAPAPKSKSSRTRSRSSRSRSKDRAEGGAEANAGADAGVTGSAAPQAAASMREVSADAVANPVAEAEPAKNVKPSRTRKPSAKKLAEDAAKAAAEPEAADFGRGSGDAMAGPVAQSPEAPAPVEPAPEPVSSFAADAPDPGIAETAEPVDDLAAAEPAAEPAAESAAESAAEPAAEDGKPKKRGWWSIAR